MKILLVEDDPGSRESLSDFLIRLGHEVVESEDGQQAVEKLAENRFHLVLSDINMPRMDGKKLLNYITSEEELKETKVILFTGHGDPNSKVEILRQGAFDYLLKPVNVHELAAVLEKLEALLGLNGDNPADE